jgi:Ala-tRNA(Pro) deacylase
MAVLPACCFIDIGRLGGLIGRGQIKLAGVEEIRRIAPACEPGGLPPFGELFGIPTFVDESIALCRDIHDTGRGISTPRSGYAPADT